MEGCEPGKESSRELRKSICERMSGEEEIPPDWEEDGQTGF
jgi:hypothetical protein